MTLGLVSLTLGRLRLLARLERLHGLLLGLLACLALLARQLLELLLGLLALLLDTADFGVRDVALDLLDARLPLDACRLRRCLVGRGDGLSLLRGGALLALVAHSGGSSPNARTQIRWAILLVAIVAREPRAASNPDHMRRLTISLSVMSPESSRRFRRVRLETVADRADDEVLGALIVAVRLLQQPEDPAGQDLLDRAVERHRGELGPHAVAERAVRLRLAHDLRDQPVRLADLGKVRAPERVRRARDLYDDHLHQLGVVAVGVDDERCDRVELLARRDVGRVGLANRLEQDVPSLDEQRVEHLVLRPEVVID